MAGKTDRPVTGLIAGIFAPPVAFVVFCLIKNPGESIFDLLKMYQSNGVLSHVISLSVIINLALFFGFIAKHYDHAARGVLGATFLYAFVVLILTLMR